MKNNSFLKDEIVDNYIEYFKSKVEYDEYLYNACCYNIKESKYIFDNYVKKQNVNNIKQGLININNINSI